MIGVGVNGLVGRALFGGMVRGRGSATVRVNGNNANLFWFPNFPIGFCIASEKSCAVGVCCILLVVVGWHGD